ncbi:ATP-binding cassette domain-containing protein [Eubacteriales bacterium KG127]
MTAQNISLEFESFHLENICFCIKKNSINILVGENGSGKTTFFKCIQNLHQFSGEIKVNGLTFSDSEYLSQIGYVSDDSCYPKILTPKQIMDIYGPLNKNFSALEYTAHLKAFGIEMDEPLLKLTKKDNVMFRLAFVLARNPKLLLLDEPFDSMKYSEQIYLLKILKEYILEKNASMIISTHLLESVKNFADKIYFIKNGKLVVREDSLPNADLENYFYNLMKGE